MDNACGATGFIGRGFYCKDSLQRQSPSCEGLWLRFRSGSYSEIIILENVFPMAGPSRVKIAMTTTATRTRMRAYSTRPWPGCPDKKNPFKLHTHKTSLP